MQDIQNLYNYLKNNLGISAVIVYIVSFINFFIYYYSFGIPIFNYIELTDLLFFFFEYIIKILIVICVAEVILYVMHVFYYRIIHVLLPLYRRKKLGNYLKSNKRNKERFLKVLELKFDANLRNFKFTVLVILVFSIGYLPIKLVLVPAYFIYLIYVLNQFDKQKFQKLTLYLFSLIIFIALILSSVYNSFTKRYNKETHTISFTEGERIISTDPEKGCLNYLGETSKNIFIYDINSKKTRIFSKENISNLQIDNTHNDIDQFVNLIINLVK